VEDCSPTVTVTFHGDMILMGSIKHKRKSTLPTCVPYFFLKKQMKGKGTNS